MAMKGFAQSVVAIGMIILLLIVIYHVGFLHIRGPRQMEDTRRVTLHQEYYTMDNALGLAKLYLETSLRYSIYQAMYDNGYRGGLTELAGGGEYAIWYDKGNSYPNEETLLGNLEGPALENLGRYLESDYVFLDSYSVKLPEYTGIKIGKTPDGDMEANASENRNLFISRTTENLDRIELERNATLSEAFSKTYLELYGKALAELDRVKEKFTEIKNLLKDVEEGSLTREQEGSPPQITRDEIFLETLKEVGIMDAVFREDGEAKLRTALEGILNKLEDRSGETVVQFGVLEKALSLGLEEAEDCMKEESQRTEGDKTIYRVIRTCSFTYLYDYIVRASVTDNSGESYPVFNARKGEISFEPLTFVFAARETSSA